MADKDARFAVLIIVGIVCVIFFSLLLTSYADLHYYEIGFKKSKTTGSVNTKRIYSAGRKWLGPTFTFKKFDAVGQEIMFNESTVYAAPDPQEDVEDDSGASLTITVDIHIIYFVIPEDLKLLHDEYDVNYHPIITSSALAALKDTASKFTLKQFYTEREEVENKLLLGIQQRLGGMCFSNCFVGCISRDQCTVKDKGLFVDARYLQLTNLKIPYEVEQRNLKTLIITEETAKESFTQQAAVIEKETEQKQILEAARREGLMTLFSSTGLSTVEHKNSFDYLRSLADNSNAHLTVDFDQLIMGPTKLP
ncbi:hypothetical protein EB796_022463 [Bugula neritina]|uniref:Band 7 domain-containing protein n=1 Tax=Bugula neritina TaxID=10212 RepID=A0A7J7IZA1_BUGNE|nr:hypothetical protein EB796_022463 [Bugula neritina]